MYHRTSILCRRSLRGYFAAFITYVMLAGQVAPVALAAPRRTPPARSATAPSTTPSKAAPRPAPIVFAAPNITATKVDAWDDSLTPDGKAEPGQTITYTVTITNTGDADATGVTFSDTVDPNTSLVPTSVQTQPIAVADSYNVIGNVRIQIPDGANDLLANDRDPDTGNNTGLTASGPTTTTQNGQITINANGSFSYNPPPGFAGTDTVTYTITDTGPDNIAGNSDDKTDTGVASFVVGNGTGTPGTNVVWFVDPSAPAGGDGRLTNPFNCYTGGTASCFSQTAADDPGDIVFLFAGAHTGGYALLNNQKLIGAGASATLASIGGLTVPTGSDALPVTNGTPGGVTITTTNVNAIPLPAGAGNTPLLRGFTVGNTGTGTKISGTTFGTLVVGNAGSPDVVLGGTGQALNLNTGTLSVAGGFSSVTTTSSASTGISLAGVADSDGAGGSAFSFGSTAVSGATTQGVLIGTTTADLSFGNTSASAAGDGVSFQNNSAGTRTFGTLSSGTSGAATSAFLHAVGGGNVTVTGLATLASVGGSTIDIQNIATGTAVNFSGGATLTKGSAGNSGVNINAPIGNVTFGGTLTIGTAGVRFPTTAVNVTGGTGTVSLGTVSIFTNGFTGISTTTDGTLNATGGTVDTGAGTALNIAGPAGITTLGMTLGTVNSTGGTNNVNVTNAGGTLTLSGGALSGASGSSFVVSGGNPTVSFGGTLTQNNAGRIVDIQGMTGGSVSFSSTITGGASSLGIHIGDTSAANANITFTTLNLGTAGARMTNQAVTIANGNAGLTYALGTFAVFTNNAKGIVATNFDGTLNCSSTSTVDTSNATALDIDGPAGLTTLGMTLVSVNSAGGTADGISIQDTDGSFSVIGDNTNTALGGNSTGGTISNKSGSDGSTTSGIGVYLNNVQNVSLRRITVNGTNQNHGIRGFRVNNFTLQYSTVNGTVGTSPSFDNYGEGAVYFGDDASTTTNGMTGVGTVTSCVFGGSRARNFSLVNTTGTLDRLTVTGSTFQVNQNFQDAGDAFSAEARNAGTVVKVTVTGSTFQGTPADHLEFVSQDGTGACDVIFQNNTITNAHAQNIVGGGGMTIATAGTLTFNASGNTMTGANGSAITLQMAAPLLGSTAARSLSGTLNNNTIGSAATLNSGSATANGIFLSLADNKTAPKGAATIAITNNQIHQYKGNAGIYADNTGGDYNVNLTITGNVTDTPGTNAFAGLALAAGAPLTTDDIDVCASVTGNNFSTGDPSNSNDIILGVSGTASSIRLPGYSGTTTAQVANFVDGNNLNSATTATTAYDDNGNGSTAPSFSGGATPCTVPTTAPSLEGGAVSRGGRTSGPTETTPSSLTTQTSNVTSAPIVSTRPSTTVVAAPRTTTPTSTAAPSTTTAAAPAATTTATPTTGDALTPVINGAGGTVSVTIGTLTPGDSVTITFRVVVDDPFNGALPQVSNQGTVNYGPGPLSTLTDDPDVAGANMTVTPVNAAKIKINDATQAEPTSGTRDMVFTVALTSPATGNISVNFTTADEPAGPGKAVAGSCGSGGDYTTTSGQVMFTTGQQVKTINVPICSDGTSEPDETFLVNLSSPINATITDGQAVGTIANDDGKVR